MLPNHKVIVINQLSTKKEGKNTLSKVMEYQFKFHSDEEYEKWLAVMTSIGTAEEHPEKPERDSFRASGSLLSQSAVRSPLVKQSSNRSLNVKQGAFDNFLIDKANLDSDSSGLASRKKEI